MRVRIAERAGFCYGVRRALSIVERAVNEHRGERIYTLGPIIHNPQAVQMLKERMGVEPISSLDEAEGGVLIIRSHGVPPALIERARAKGLKVIDATCPFVKRAQNKARQLAEEGYQVVIFGEKEHPEVIGILGHLPDGRAYVVETPEEIDGLPPMRRVGVIFQTTQEMRSFGDMLMKLLLKSEELKIHNTICHAIRDQQAAARRLAEEADVMLVVGGRNSGNTRRLVQICRDAGAKSYHIETADEIDPSWLEGAELVGVAAGASTPDFIIEGVLERLKSMGAEVEGRLKRSP